MIVGAANGGLLEKLDQASTNVAACPAKKKRRLSRRSTNEQIERAVREHLGPVSPVEFHHRLIDGKSLQETIAEQKRAAKAGKKRMGASFWKEVKHKFGITAVQESLQVKTASETVAPELVRALELATCANPGKRNMSLLETFFGECDGLNQKECVGIVRHMMGKKVGCNKKNRAVFVAFARCVGRLDVVSQFEEELQLLKDVVVSQIAPSLWISLGIALESGFLFGPMVSPGFQPGRHV